MSDNEKRCSTHLALIAPRPRPPFRTRHQRLSYFGKSLMSSFCPAPAR
jgi:hypothetical protein